MPYETARGRLTRSRDVVLHASGAETATGNDTGLELGDHTDMRLKLDVTAVAGTVPTLDVTLETSFDNGVTDAWRTLGAFAQKTAVSSERKAFAGCDRWVRSRRTIGGTTPSVTYSISGEAV
ncbi:MAG: hypothetical protein LC792_01985 [Actinobacteria bacterium]|nr:hypothetical protein [Actinomycetota bacterium]